MNSSEAATREAPLASRHPWFLDLYAALLDDPAAAQPAIAARFTDADASDPVEAALALFLASLYAQATGEPGLLRSPRGKVLRDLVATRLERELAPSVNTYSDTWVVALWAAALREANFLLPSEETARLVGRVKNHVYAWHVRMGGLMSSSDRTTLDFDVLLAAVPFGLFDCEDLVLVDSVRTLVAPGRLAAAGPADRLLLAWYYAEQGSYAKSRRLLAETGVAPIKAIVSRRLKALGQLDARFIHHSPEGNGNRYEPLREERFPKLITQDNDVIVRAQAAPLSPDEPLELAIGDVVVSGAFKGDCWEFVIPRRPAGSQVTYTIRFIRHPEVAQGPFTYEVLARQELGGIVAVSQLDTCLRIQAVNGELTLDPCVDGTLCLAIAPDGPVSLDGVTGSNWQVGDFSCRRAPAGLVISKHNQDLITIAGAQWLQSADGRVHEISLTLAHPPCGYYGFGERYNALNQAGNRVDQFVYNQYKEQGLRTYIPMPVAYTDAGFGLHLDTDSYSWFDLGTPGSTRLGVEEDHLSINLFAGPIANQVAQFMAVTGEPEPVPAWALGPWMSSNNWDSEAEVRKQVALTLEHGIPATVLVIEAWSDEATFYIFNDAQYAEKPGAEAFRYGDFTFPEWGRWPDPKGMAEHLHANDLKLILWQIPILKQSPSLKHGQKRRDEAYFFERNFGVRHPDGTPLRLPEGWFKDSLLMDFTNAEGRNWWFSKRQYLIDELGVDGFKTDGGEMVWGRDLVFADGRTGLKSRNAYPRDYISAYYRFAQQNGGICFSRAGYTGAQTFPAHWAGDERSTWEAFKRSILAGLSAGMSGVIFWGWDMAGFSGEVPSAELYVRSAQMACFCPIMQYHAESKAEFNQDRTPWNIAERSGDGRALTGYRFYANLRMQLMPYLARESAWCVAEKQPLMRAMILDFQDSPEVVSLWDQYLFGRDLLVAPIIREGATTREVVLPAGRWWHLFECRWYEAGTHQTSAPLEEIPVFIRAGTVLPLAFHREARLGAAMPSDIAAARDTIWLVAGLCEKQSIVHDEMTLTLRGGVVHMSGAVHRATRILFTDTPMDVRRDGASIPLIGIVLHRDVLHGVVIQP